MEETRTFNGGLNFDDSLYDIAKGWYLDSLNITKNDVYGNNDLVATNIVGNRLVAYTLPSGINVTIGARDDILRNRVYEFIWNSNGYHSILIYDNTTRTKTKLIENLTDSGGVDILQFTRYNKIIHIPIIPRSDNEGDLLFWTDGNVSLRKLNVKHIQDSIYGVLKIPFIELAKQPPRNPVLAVYGNDATRNANSLRKKLLQATYRFCYDDFEKSSFTTYSKIPLPIGYYGSDNDIDNTKNNFITFTIETGDVNVTDIEIAVRFNIGSVWADFLLIISLNKVQLNIPSNTTYNYLFYNDGVYPPITDSVDVTANNVQVIPLFDWVPKKADSLVMANGDAAVPAGITEGYPAYPQSQLDVTITAENKVNIPPDTGPPSITYITSGNTFTFTVKGSVPTGTVYLLYIFFNGNPGIGQTYGVRLVGNYTSIGGDTIDTVAVALYNQFNSYPSVPIIGGSQSSNFWNSTFGTSGNFVQQILVTPGSPGVGNISSEKTYLYNANYLFGLGYKDDQGRLIPGVTTFVNPVDSSNDFLVTTPSLSFDGSFNVKTPVISASINHLPATDAVTYSWDRRRMTYSDFIMYVTCDYQDPSDGYLYFCLANIEYYKALNSQFIYSTVPLLADSRIKIMGTYAGDLWNQDYEILGTVTRSLTGSSPAIDKLFIKVNKPIAAISPAYSASMIVMVYTPMANPTDIADSVFWEWAEEYAIYTGTNIVYSALAGTFADGETVTGGTSGATGRIVGDNGTTEMTLDTVVGTFIVGEGISGSTSSANSNISSIATQNYHRGKDQDQTATQPAKFTWVEGDVYFHKRTMYDNITSSPGSLSGNVMDANWSDFFPSAVNDNGRGLSIQVNARETYLPATMRFSREYQQNTNINQTNRFIYANFIDLDRSYGSILKMSIKDRYIRIGQQFKIGLVPLFSQINVDANGNGIRADSDKLLNPVQYYERACGVGDAPESWTDFNNSSYFFDTNRGIWYRLAQDGEIDISVKYKINSWTSLKGILRKGNYKIYGAFDSKSNNCIFAFEATDTDPAYTLAFNEDTNTFESPLSYHPEMMVTLGNLLITFKNGSLYTHDSPTYNRFYGVDYPSYITAVFNLNAVVKKSFVALTEGANTIWECPEISTQVMSYGLLPQESNLIAGDFDNEEGEYIAPFRQDTNSIGGLINGDDLHGKYIIVKFMINSASSLVVLNYASVKSLESALTSK